MARVRVTIAVLQSSTVSAREAMLSLVVASAVGACGGQTERDPQPAEHMSGGVSGVRCARDAP